MEVGEAKKAGITLFKPRKKKVKGKEIVIFSRQLSTLVSSGIPIVQGLSILEEQTLNPSFKEVIGKIRGDIEGGLSIGDALSKHPKLFSELYVNMVRSGELGGILDVILERLSSYLESADALKRKVKSAMMYPVIIAIFAGGVTAMLLTVVVPKFVGMFLESGMKLPLPTQILWDLSNFLKSSMHFLIIGIIALVVGFKYYHKTPAGKRQVDKLMLKIPMFGEMLLKVAVAKFTRTFGTLVKSGVPILQALDTVAKTSGNKIIEEAILKARDSIREGERISDPLKESGVFPPMVTQMISVGEETGNLDTMLMKIADFYDNEVDPAVTGLTALIEPVVIVVLGVIIGSVVLALYMPMFEMGELAGR